MTILLHERPVEVSSGTTLHGLRARFRPSSDILILNGAVVADDRPLSDGDAVHLICRGVMPSAAEMQALLVARHTPGVHAAVRHAVVGIAGLGGLGSTVAIALARTGVGKLVLADFDVVEPSNLNRQQYSVDQLGLLKTDALCRVLAGINPYTVAEAHTVRLGAANILDVFAGVQVLVEAFDRPDAKSMLVHTFSRHRPEIPVITASGLAGYGPANRIRTRRVACNLYLVGDEESEARPGMGLMAPRVGVAASHQANAVLRLLLGLDPVEEPVG